MARRELYNVANGFTVSITSAGGIILTDTEFNTEVTMSPSDIPAIVTALQHVALVLNDADNADSQNAIKAWMQERKALNWAWWMLAETTRPPRCTADNLTFAQLETAAQNSTTVQAILAKARAIASGEYDNKQLPDEL